jgi:hypothetical protein
MAHAGFFRQFGKGWRMRIQNRTAPFRFRLPMGAKK